MVEETLFCYILTALYSKLRNETVSCQGLLLATAILDIVYTQAMSSSLRGIPFSGFFALENRVMS